MKTLVNRIVVSSLALMTSALPLLAQEQAVSSWWFRPRPRPPVTVPEIDASTGLLAVAAVLAILAFVAERRRRSA
jgi:hypothetical protein